MIKEIKKELIGFWKFLQKDTWPSWIVSVLLIVISIKFILFPTLSFITGSPLPLVVIESCSMYHESDFEEWWIKNSAWYESKNISKTDFLSYNFKNGLNKGDIILVIGKKEYKKGDIIIFNAQTKHPLIHRLIDTSPLSTKGDHNSIQLSIEETISKEAVIGKSFIRIPFIGWIKLIFFEPFRTEDEKGLC